MKFLREEHEGTQEVGWAEAQLLLYINLQQRQVINKQSAEQIAKFVR